jgi:hypothetical protein
MLQQNFYFYAGRTVCRIDENHFLILAIQMLPNVEFLLHPSSQLTVVNVNVRDHVIPHDFDNGPIR